PEILKDDADAPAQRGKRVLAERRDVVIEQRDQPARGPQREEQETQERTLAGTRGAGEKLERARLDAERKIVQHLGTEAVAQSHMLEPDHCLSPRAATRPEPTPAPAAPG